MHICGVGGVGRGGDPVVKRREGGGLCPKLCRSVGQWGGFLVDRSEEVRRVERE